MMTLSLDHDVSEKKCEMRQKIIQKIIIMRAPHSSAAARAQYGV
jgi:hypothetical protein